MVILHHGSENVQKDRVTCQFSEDNRKITPVRGVTKVTFVLETVFYASCYRDRQDAAVPVLA